MEKTKKERILNKIAEALGIIFIDEDEAKELEQLEEQIQEIQGYETSGSIAKLENIVDSKKDTKGGKGKSTFSEELKVKATSKEKPSTTKTRSSEGKTLGDE